MLTRARGLTLFEVNTVRRVLFEFVRYKKRPAPKRKPIWAPTAPSKMFYVPEKPVISEEESQQLCALYNDYRTAIKSIRSYFIEEYERKEELKPHGNQLSSEDEEEHAELIAWNNEENKRVVALRDEFRIKEKAEEEEKRRKFKEERDEEHQLRLAEVEEMVRKEKEESDSFVVREKLEEAINYALCHPKTYEYAIDFEGNKIFSSLPKQWAADLESSNSLIEHSLFKQHYPQKVKESEDMSFRTSK